MPSGNFLFTLKTAANTSAGVYDVNGVLIRTLWSLVPHAIGNHTKYWDGKDDFGNTATGTTYTIKVLSSNTNYLWEGVIGNSSDFFTGSTSMVGYDTAQGIAASSSFLYSAMGYGEFSWLTWKSQLATLNQKINVETNSGTGNATGVCTDGINVYWANVDSFSTGHTFVYATKCSDDSNVTFSAGTGNYSQTFGNTYNTISLLNTATTLFITGIAVQQTHNYLFVSRAAGNTLQVYHKTTGALAQYYSLTNAGAMSVDASDNLWLAHGGVVEKYTVNSGTGAITTTGISIPISNVGAVACSPDGNTIIVADINAQQVKAFSASTGASGWVLGTGVSYSGNPIVANNKFYWSDVNGQYPTYLCFLPDGTFMVGDQMNYRTQHFAANRTFIESIGFIPHFYTCWVNQNDPTRVFTGNLEYSIDYTKPIADAWTLTNTWGGNYVTAGDRAFGVIGRPITLSNGRTYCLVRGVIVSYLFYLAELVAGGILRITTLAIGSGIGQGTGQGTDGYIDADGSLVQIIYNFTNCIIKRFSLTGFDASNNPTWTGSSTTTTPTIASNTVFNPAIPSNSIRTTNGNFINYDNNQVNSGGNGKGYGYHIQSIPEGASGTNKWASAIDTVAISGATYKGPYPGRGLPAHYFDGGNGSHGGSFYGVSGNHIVWGYNGEFWKSSETNMYHHLDDNTGLMVGQFGVTDLDWQLFKVSAPAGGAGNALTGSLVSISGNTYLYHCDESYHGGIHRWKFNNLSSVTTQQAKFPVSIPVTPVGGVDLLSGLTRGAVVTNGLGGWLRSPSTDYSNATGGMFTSAGSTTISAVSSSDIYLEGSVNQANTSFYVARPLPNFSQLAQWTVSGQCYFPSNSATKDVTTGGGGIIQVLDPAGKVIVQMYVSSDYAGNSGISININTPLIWLSGESLNIFSVAYQTYENFSFNYLNGKMTISWFNYSMTVSSPSDVGADMSNPATFRIYFYTGPTSGGFTTVGHITAVANLRFLAGPPKNG